MLSDLLAKDVVSDNFATINENETISKAINFFDDRGLHAIVVFDDENNYKGMLVERWIYRSRLDPTQTKVKALCRRVTKAYESTSLVEVAKYMIGSGVQAVPVFKEEGEVIGVVRDIDLLAHAIKEKFSELKAIDHATTELITLSPKDTVAKAIAVFRDNHISRAPIVEDGRLAGIITVHDIVVRFIIPREKIKYGTIKAERIKPLNIELSKVMSSPVFTINIDESIGDAVELMKEHEISGVVIVDSKNRPAGILTKKDLLEALIKQASLEERKAIQIQLAGKYEDIDSFDMGHIRKGMESFMSKMEKMFEYGLITLHFKKIKDTRKESTRYIIRMRFIAPKKVYAAHHEGFNVLEVMQVLMDKIERVVISDKEHARTGGRLRGYLSKYKGGM